MLLPEVTTANTVGSISIMWPHNGEVSPHIYAINTAHSISITLNKGSTFKAVRKMSSIINIIIPSHNFCYEGGHTINISWNFFNGRLEWLGHVIKMNQRRMTKKIISHKPEGTQNVGKPKPRLLGKLPNNIPLSKMKGQWPRPNNKESACVLWQGKFTGVPQAKRQVMSSWK